MPPSTHGSRPSRMASVYETLVTHPNSTVSSLMRQTRLSRPTITTLLDSLTEMGLVAPQGAEGSVGRPAETWAPRQDAGASCWPWPSSTARSSRRTTAPA